MIREQLRAVDRRLLMAGAGLAGVALGLVLLVTVFGGDGGQAVSGVPTGRPRVLAAEASAPENSATVQLPAVLPGRDPFRQLAVPGAAISELGAAPAPPVAPVPAPSPTPPVAPSPAPSTSAPSTDPPVDTGAKASLELKSVVTDGAGVARATITVDGLSYTLSQGEVFSYGFRLERIDGNCVEVSADAARATMCVPAARP